MTLAGELNSKLILKEIKEISGEASIAVVRGKERIGYELTFTSVFSGEGDLSGLECELEVEELCDDGSDLANIKFTVNKLEDT